ncbi:TonB-dependent receptor [Xylella fastidiosa]|uniref:TonB-dependent receptor n=1 Tax=Xylella fastidiosa TaxID=2371 RepID=UPI000FFE8A30|nr:TonB-dependent receptor [Xylella fastidiosa]RWA37834.1 TonB-dependent receptor [Xylella fastidiosa subsp. multiplex]
MKFKPDIPHRLLVVSLAIAIATFAPPSIVFAQEKDTSAAAVLDAVNVTGTRLKSQSMTASSPVAEINAEEFQYSGATKVEDLVNQYPQLSLNFDGFTNNGSDGYATVDLRGLGAKRTLTLVNGRRIPKGIIETPDITIIPTAIVKRVDLLTGGASAVYGSDAIAGVVNFVLDDAFHGISVNAGYSAYQHNNDNTYMRGLMDKAGYPYPKGGSGFDGVSRNIDLAIGGNFGESGHATTWVTWRQNDGLLQGQRDYSSCALKPNGTGCGGSLTANPPNFNIVAPTAGTFFVLPSANGTWSKTDTPNLYNYAPVNYYQRPDTRYTAGTNIQYEINSHFKPYVEALFVNHRSSTQIAPSGTFFNELKVNCSTAVIGSLCNDVGITDSAFSVYVAKRNIEGGPRSTNTDTSSGSITAGTGGNLIGNWSYDASFTYNRSATKSESFNDFITTRVHDALLGCPTGSFDGCVPYNVWTNNISAAAAQSLQGVGIVNYTTSMKVFNAYVTGDFGYALPWANNKPINLVAGYEWRTEGYTRTADSNTQAGNFAGSGGPTSNVDNSISVKELFLESAVPLLANTGILKELDLQFGYRRSKYDVSGSTNTYKAGFGASFAEGQYLLRGGWNRAIRAPSITELYEPNTIALWDGSDPCAGTSPTFTQAQCANTGVTAARYGNITANPSGQYNKISGGNKNLKPEIADTWTLGFAATPIKNLDLSADYYSIKIKDTIRTIGASNILAACALTNDANLCSRIRRNSATGDLFLGSDPATSGLVLNSRGNFGALQFRGIDLTASYAWNVGPGRLTTNMIGNYVIKQDYQPVPGISDNNYSCAGIVNTACGDTDGRKGGTSKWRHMVNVRYGFDRYTMGLRWRYIGKMNYEDTDGTPGSTDKLVVNGGNRVSAYNYLDLTGSIQLDNDITWTMGLNNVFDREPPLVGSSLSYNGNALKGYDQAGRYFFTSIGLKF